MMSIKQIVNRLFLISGVISLLLWPVSMFIQNFHVDIVRLLMVFIVPAILSFFPIMFSLKKDNWNNYLTTKEPLRIAAIIVCTLLLLFQFFMTNMIIFPIFDSDKNLSPVGFLGYYYIVAAFFNISFIYRVTVPRALG
jgi:hypothetical protein